MLNSSEICSKASSKLRRSRRAACNLSVWLLAGGALLLPSEVWAYVVSGHVETSGGGAVAGAGISFSDSNGEAASTTSAPDGSYSVDLPANTYSVEVTPPEASGLLPQSQPGVVVTANTTLDIVLVDVSPAAYGGVLRDLSGTPIANARLWVSGDGFSYTGSTNASGQFSISASTGSTRVRVSCDSYYDCSRFGEGGYGDWYNIAIDLTGGSVTNAVLEWPIYTLNGSVLTDEPSSLPVPDAEISYSSYGYEANGQVFETWSWATSDAQGLFSFAVSPGEGEVSVEAPEGSQLLNGSAEVVVAYEDPLDVEVVLAEPLEYAGTLVDSNGAPIANARMRLTGDGSSYLAVTDETGSFSLHGSAASDTVSIDCDAYYDCALFGDSGYGELNGITVDLSAGSVTGASLVWPVRTLTGVVVDPAQSPVEDAEVSSQTYLYDEQTGVWSNTSSYQSTSASGAFSLVVGLGEADLSVTAPDASGLQNASTTIIVENVPEDPDPLTIALESAVVYAGTLQDDAGSPIAGARVRLQGDGFTYSGTTDELGHFSIAASTESNKVYLSCDAYYECLHFGPNGYAEISGLSIDLSSGGINDAVLVWPIHELQCTVTDIDGLPVSGVPASWDSSDYDDVTGVSSSASNYSTTDVDGKLTIRTSPGDGELTITPEQGSGLTPFKLERTVAGDSSLAILVQFAAEATSETVEAGGSVSTDAEGDGATPQDPIETLIVSAQAGEVTIDEVPVSETPPAGVRFLTQQISIEAPPSTPDAPIQITFLLDGSRIPEGFGYQDIDVYRNGSLVGECPGSSIADPDPCITERELVEGDVRVVVLTSHASEWNFGVTSSQVDCESAADCNDADACTTDACIQGSCVNTTLSSCGTGGTGGTGGTSSTGGTGGSGSTSDGGTGGSGECVAASDCNDFDPCTADTCVRTVCSHQPISTGSCGEDPADDPDQPSGENDDTNGPTSPPGARDPRVDGLDKRAPKSGCSLQAVGAEGEAGSRSGLALLLLGAALAASRQRRRR